MKCHCSRNAVARLFCIALLGAATTVAVSWYYALRVDPDPFVSMPSPLLGKTGVALYDLLNREFQHYELAEVTPELLERVEVFDALWRVRITTEATPAGDRDFRAATVALLEAANTRGPGLPSWTNLPRLSADHPWVQRLIAEGHAARTDHVVFPYAIEEAAGFPLLAMRATITRTSPAGDLTGWKASGGLPVPLAWSAAPLPYLVFADFAVLPLRPIWLGFLINTLFFSIAWFGILEMTPNLIRRWRARRRRAHGCCANCGYDVSTGGLSVCPECGQAVVSRA